MKDRLEAVRNRLGVQWQDFAVELGVSRQMLTLVKKGQRCFGPEPASKLKELESKLNIVYSDLNDSKIPEMTGELMAPYMDQESEVIRIRRELQQARSLIDVQARTIADQAQTIKDLVADNSLNDHAALASGAGGNIKGKAQ